MLTQKNKLNEVTQRAYQARRNVFHSWSSIQSRNPELRYAIDDQGVGNRCAWNYAGNTFPYI
jgi:hypothetical protein